MNIIIILFTGGGGNPFGILIGLILVVCVLSSLFNFMAENWGIISLILGITAIIFAIIKSSKSQISLIENMKTHGLIFSLLWWIGTLMILFTGLLIKKNTEISLNEIEIGFSIIFGIPGILIGLITGWKIALEEISEISENALYGAIGFGSIAFIFTFIQMVQNLSNILNGIFSLILGTIIFAIIGAVLGAVLGAIGKIFNIGGAFTGGLLGLVIFGGLSVFLGILFSAMIKSTSGTIGAAMLVLTSSYGLFNIISNNEDRDRIICLILFWFIAIALFLLPRFISLILSQ